MGLDFGKSSMGNPAQAGNGLQEKNEIEVVEKYDIIADRQQMNAELVNSKEVDDIVSTIEVTIWIPLYLLVRKQQRRFPRHLMWSSTA